MIEIGAAETHTFWQITLGMGFVVLLVVIALLTLLLRYVRDIDEGVEGLTGRAKAVAANTVAIQQLPTTASVLREIRDEALIHQDLLSKR